MYPYSYSKGEISMLNQNYTTKLLNLEDVIITNVENICEELHINIELPRKKHICPACGSATDYVHDYRMQTIKDVPLARNTFLHLRKRRYRCTCGKRFFEKNTFLPRYYRVTSRLVAEIIHAFEKVVPAKEIGCLPLQRIRHDCHALFQMRKSQTHRTAGGTLSGRVQGKLRWPEV